MSTVETHWNWREKRSCCCHRGHCGGLLFWFVCGLFISFKIWKNNYCSVFFSELCKEWHGFWKSSTLFVWHFTIGGLKLSGGWQAQLDLEKKPTVLQKVLRRDVCLDIWNISFKGWVVTLEKFIAPTRLLQAWPTSVWELLGADGAPLSESSETRLASAAWKILRQVTQE